MVRRGQKDREYGAALRRPGAALEVQHAPVFLHNILHQRQSRWQRVNCIGRFINYTRGHITITNHTELEHAACECYRTIRDEFRRLNLLWDDRGYGRRAEPAVLHRDCCPGRCRARPRLTPFLLHL